MWFVWMIGGAVIGFVVGYATAARKVMTDSGSGSAVTSMSLLQKQTEEKQKRLAQIEEYLKTHEQVTNQEVAKMLGVDDSTVVRYFDELEKQGKLVQVGTTGRSVTYKKT